jgi:hypothetical protein
MVVPHGLPFLKEFPIPGKQQVGLCSLQFWLM